MVITTINRETYSQFTGLLPVTELEKVLLEKKFGLGAILETDDGYVAAGTLVFSTEVGMADDQEVLTAVLGYLYIDTRYRRQGAAEALMQEFLKVLDRSGIEHVICDIPMPGEYNELCAYLESWGFLFNLTDVYKVETTLGELLHKPFMAKESTSDVLPLSMLSEKEFTRYFNQIMRKSDVPISLKLDRNKDYYDKNVSCCIRTKDKVSALLLVHVSAREILEVEYLGALNGEVKDIVKLVLYAAHAAAPRYKEDISLEYMCRSETSCNVTNKLFPEIQPLLVRRGYLNMLYEQHREG